MSTGRNQRYGQAIVIALLLIAGYGTGRVALAAAFQSQSGAQGWGETAAMTVTSTPFIPTATATLPPTLTPTATLAPNQPAPTATPTKAAAAICSVVPPASAPTMQHLAGSAPLSSDQLSSTPRVTAPHLRRMAPFAAHLRHSHDITAGGSVTMTANVSGTVRFPNQAPLADALVLIYPLDAQGNVVGEALVEQLTNADGYFDTVLADGDYWLEIEPPLFDMVGLPVSGVWTLAQSFTVASTANLGELLLPATTKQITGRLVDPSDNSVTQAVLYAFHYATGRYAAALPQPDGTFSLPVVGGTWELFAVPDVGVPWVIAEPAYTAIFAEDTSVESRNGFRFTAQPADAWIYGQVTLPNGSPLPVLELDANQQNPYVSFELWDTTTERFAYSYVDASGQFTIPVLSGNFEALVWLDNSHYSDFTGKPLSDPLNVVTGTVALGKLAVLANTALLSGTVTDSDGQPLSNVDIEIWQENGLWLDSTTNEAGHYSLAAPAGLWQVAPSPADDQPHLFTAQPTTVLLTAEETAQANFALEPAAGFLMGTLVDPDQQLAVTADAIAYLRRGGDSAPISVGAVENGHFRLKLPYGDLHVGLYLAPEAPYLPPAEVAPTAVMVLDTLATLTNRSLLAREQVAFTQLAQGDKTIVLQLVPTDARISGKLIDDTGAAVTNTTGYVVATKQGDSNIWKWSEVDPTDGSYSLPVNAGVWELTYNLDADAPPYLPAPSTATAVTVTTNTTLTQNLTVLLVNRAINGIVVNEAGKPLPNVSVLLRHSNQEATARSRVDGTFVLYLRQAPTGRQVTTEDQTFNATIVATADPSYAAVGVSGKQPMELSTDLPLAQVANRTNPRFTVILRHNDAYLTGQVLNGSDNNTPVQGALVTAINTVDGQSFNVTTDANGCFAARINQNGLYNWELNGKFQDTATGFIATAKLMIAGSALPISGQTGQAMTTTLSSGAMVLDYRGAAPATVNQTFAVADGWSFTLPDGFRIEIPPHAINTREKQVVIEVRPTVKMPETLIYTLPTYGYQITLRDRSGKPITSEFYKAMRLTFRYVEALIPDESRLLAGRLGEQGWLWQQQATPDRAMNMISLSTQVPGSYALLVEKLDGVGASNLYLPLITR